MKKIALITATTGLNSGNEFINQGCLYLINKLFPKLEIKQFEALDTVSDNYISYLSIFKKELNTFDIIFVACGSLISKIGIKAIKNILKLKSIKVFLGLGMFQYNDEEKEYCREIELKKDTYYFVRDNETYKMFTNKNKNIYRGIDCAFFMSDVIKKIYVREKYAVINIDSIQDNYERIKNVVEDLKKHYKYVFVVENTMKRYNLPELKYNYIFISQWYQLYQLYQNASFVITNRVHTMVVCLLNRVPAGFTWTYLEKTKRLKLFNRIGIIVKEDVTILEDYRQQIEEYKIKFFNLLKEFLNNISEC